jgi:hypothetical protein
MLTTGVYDIQLKKEKPISSQSKEIGFFCCMNGNQSLADIAELLK